MIFCEITGYDMKEKQVSSSDLPVFQDELEKATVAVMDFCQAQGMTELLAYMAMTYICKTMEEELGFGSKRRTNS